MKKYLKMICFPILIFYASIGNAAFNSKSEMFRKLYERGLDSVVELDSSIYDFQASGRIAYQPKSLVVDLNSQEKKNFNKVRISQLDFKLDTSSMRHSVFGDEYALAYIISDVMICYDAQSHIYRSEQKCYIFTKSIQDVLKVME